MNGTHCRPCADAGRDGFTTVGRASTAVSNCSVAVIPAEHSFLKFERSYFFHSNVRTMHAGPHPRQTDREGRGGREA